MIVTDGGVSRAKTAREPARSGGDGRRLNARAQILEAARVALTQVGYEHITTRRIAEQAGVNVATLHYYFGTKEALLSEALRHALARSEARLRAAIEDAPTSGAALERAFTEAWEMVRERPGILRYDVVVRGLRDEEARREAQAIYAALRGLVDRILDRHFAEGGGLAPDVTPALFTAYVVAAVDGVVLQHTVTDDDDLARRSLDLILRHAHALMGYAPGEPQGRA